jgi:hypothetical protein
MMPDCLDGNLIELIENKPDGRLVQPFIFAANMRSKKINPRDTGIQSKTGR